MTANTEELTALVKAGDVVTAARKALEAFDDEREAEGGIVETHERRVFELEHRMDMLRHALRKLDKS